ncbi:NUDIX hydrolase [Kocuria sabuli]|uniref:NUDIX hydrolase n=1 Tax=Kocuria sabuli TaxID=3071448 RepID=UPI0034D4A7D4
MNIVSWNVEPRRHPTDPSGYYEFLEPGEMAPLLKPVPGWRFHGVREDGTLFNFPRGRTSTDPATCEKSRALFMFSPPAPAPEHDLDCSCGVRVVKDLGTLVSYMRHLATNNRFEDPFLPHGPTALSVVSVTGTGYAAAMPEHRVRGGKDPRDCIRVEQVHLGSTMYLAQAWADGTPAPDGLEDRVREQYPDLTIHRVPTIYQIPGVPFIRLPELGGEVWHSSGRYGRYGGAGALLRREDKFLLIRRRDNGCWSVPGGANASRDVDPWETARAEAREEAHIHSTSEPYGSTVWHGEDGWTFRTYAADTTDTGPRRTPRNGEVIDAGWFTETDMHDLDLMPEFEEVLPELLALFEEN